MKFITKLTQNIALTLSITLSTSFITTYLFPATFSSHHEWKMARKFKRKKKCAFCFEIYPEGGKQTVKERMDNAGENP